MPVGQMTPLNAPTCFVLLCVPYPSLAVVSCIITLSPTSAPRLLRSWFPILHCTGTAEEAHVHRWCNKKRAAITVVGELLPQTTTKTHHCREVCLRHLQTARAYSTKSHKLRSNCPTKKRLPQQRALLATEQRTSHRCHFLLLRETTVLGKQIIYYRFFATL